MAFRDISFAFRLLKNNPGFAAFAVATLALGTGANTAIFTAVDAMLVRPLPYGNPERLVTIWEDASYVGFPRNNPAPANYLDWKTQGTSFEKMGASRYRRFAVRVGKAAPEDLGGMSTTPDLFDVLESRPVIGRTYTEQEDKEGARVAVISYGLWQRAFGGEASAVGQSMDLDGVPHQIIGVMPAGFFYPDRQREIWTPIGFDSIRTRRGMHYLRVTARLRPGATVEAAAVEMKTISGRLAAQYPDTNAKVGSVVLPLQEDLTGTVRTALLALLGAAAFVLLIACANLANLLLARATGRSREIAVRLAVGADRRSLLTQLLTESVLLALLGGAAGSLVALAALQGLERMMPLDLAIKLTLNARTLGFAIAVSGAAGLLFGLAPALQSARVDLNTALKQAGRAGVGGGHGWLRDALVAGEFALAFLLLAGAGLLIQTIAHLSAVDAGFRPERVLTARVSLLPGKYPTDEHYRQFYRSAIERLTSLPGVESAAFASNLPYQTIGNTNYFEIEGRPVEQDFDALYREVTPNYFLMMGARLITGRWYTEADTVKTTPVIVINETFQRRYWPKGDAVGKRIRYSTDSPWMVIVGVVQDLRERGAELAMKPATYPSVNQVGRPRAGALAVRTSGDPVSMAPAVREALRALDADAPVSQVRSMEEVLELSSARSWSMMKVLSVFAGLAVLLAAIGVYGVLSYAVSQRVREIGLRMALGADSREVTRMVAGRGLVLGGIGLAVGALGSVFVMRVLQTMLFGVSPHDPAVLSGAAGLMLCVAVAASLVPAWRASRVDPMTALRED